MVGSTRPVLVTGSHRSGSTWLGRLLASADELHYVQEPFNIVDRQRWLHPRPPRQFLYITTENEDDWLGPMADVINLRYPWLAHLRTFPSPRMTRRVAGVTMRARASRRRGCAALLKDPIAIFSTEWLALRFDVRPLILVRDPVAFVGSLKDRNWTFDFRHWADQPLLMRDHLETWADDIARMIAEPTDVVEQGILMWNVIYGFVDDLRRRDPSVLVVNYETLASNPLVEVETLFRRLGLRYGDEQHAAVIELTTGSGGTGTTAIDVRRDSQLSLETWRDRLTPDEIDAVRSSTASIADRLGRVGNPTASDPERSE